MTIAGMITGIGVLSTAVTGAVWLVKFGAYIFTKSPEQTDESIALDVQRREDDVLKSGRPQ